MSPIKPGEAFVMYSARTRYAFAVAILFLSAHAAVAQSTMNSRVLVVYNSADSESIDVANYYAAQRNIPLQNLCPITPSQKIGLPWVDYQAQVKQPVRNCLSKVGTSNILYIVLSYNTPYLVT